MANKYIALNTNGDLQEVTFNSTSGGTGDAGKGVALNAAGLIDNTMLPQVAVTTMVAFEAIAAGGLINIMSTGQIRNANASSALRAHGYILSALAIGASGPVILGDGLNSSLIGLVTGSSYFLSTIGTVSTVVPSVTGQIVQPVGVAISNTTLAFRVGEVIIRA